jgi:hypothetical protein
MGRRATITHSSTGCEIYTPFRYVGRPVAYDESVTGCDSDSDCGLDPGASTYFACAECALPPSLCGCVEEN